MPAAEESGRVGAISSFRLKKWYLDAADERGNVYIGYWAAVRWNKLSLNYHEHIWRTPKAGIASRSAFTVRPAPAWESEDRLIWNTPEAHAQWISSRDLPLSARLLETEQGSVDWHCYLPKASASVQLPELTVSGWGYVECLDLSLPPWELPLKTLYWGRAHSQDHYMVWIKCDGLTRRSLLWHDGQCDGNFDLLLRAISSTSISLHVQNSCTLRKGPIRSTVLRSLGKLLARVPAQALLIDEHKLFGTGQIVADGRPQPATAIYEEVHW